MRVVAGSERYIWVGEYQMDGVMATAEGAEETMGSAFDMGFWITFPERVSRAHRLTQLHSHVHSFHSTSYIRMQVPMYFSTFPFTFPVACLFARTPICAHPIGIQKYTYVYIYIVFFEKMNKRLCKMVVQHSWETGFGNTFEQYGSATRLGTTVGQFRCGLLCANTSCANTARHHIFSKHHKITTFLHTYLVSAQIFIFCTHN